jgi:polysaccharide biosynthesis/export protein
MVMHRNITTRYWILLAAFGWTYCLAQPSSTTQFGSRDESYRIEPSDVIEIFFTFTPEFNQAVTVQPDGFISLRGAGQVKIGGLTIPKATNSVIAAYSATLHAPAITLALKEFSRPTFVIAGYVAKPGKYDLHGDVTLTDAVAIAGGFAMGAKDSSVLLFRRVSRETVEVKKFNVKQMLGKGRLTEDPVLQAGDSIFVSESPIGKVDRFMKIARLGLYFPLPSIP